MSSKAAKFEPNTTEQQSKVTQQRLLNRQL